VTETVFILLLVAIPVLLTVLWESALQKRFSARQLGMIVTAATLAVGALMTFIRLR
jgi:uncharacterized membrane protein YfcA